MFRSLTFHAHTFFVQLTNEFLDDSLDERHVEISTPQATKQNNNNHYISKYIIHIEREDVIE